MTENLWKTSPTTLHWYISFENGLCLFSLRFVKQILSRVVSHAALHWCINFAGSSYLCDATQSLTCDKNFCGFCNKLWYFFGSCIKLLVNPFTKRCNSAYSRLLYCDWKCYWGYFICMDCTAHDPRWIWHITYIECGYSNAVITLFLNFLCSSSVWIKKNTKFRRLPTIY